MRIFVDKDFKVLFCIIIFILLSSTISGQLVVNILTDNYRKEMIEHDYKIAGYLYQNNIDQSEIINAFTISKTEKEFELGKEILKMAGYNDSIQNNLIPQIKNFHQKYSILFMITSIFFSITIITALLIFDTHQQRKIEKASKDISKFMDGDIRIRLDDNKEGNLSKLFTSINRMATSLTSHILKEKQNREFLKDIISDISHQLKTPIAALKMYNEIIIDEKIENEVVHNFALKSDSELSRMESLIQSLLKLARLDAGTIELDRKNHNLKSSLEQLIKRFYTCAELENKLLILNCNDNIILNFDEEWLLEAISNIIKNALDHTACNGIVEIICDKTFLSTTITIKDNGSGIHSEDIYYVFKKFYRSRFSKNKQGIGIGLTFSKFIVEKHGGTIAVESELDKGTIFYLTFPKLTNM
ncbi:putative sensory transduction histidine kinase [Gottschalkia acidurici 9a]|uniref:histidine kinase n=1 Tax=Gottschalkia acidurici (strain ATCC 7906 / DSM 604 / BCRC 14475 / CIP 104303 / KCTC 5404 / NCIMB 10678 / 9a) TaxID=1128398 RepID=K0AVH8_GOTA9|nr:HAMP domain-containing sensor histidine kinase [Gottschalkia acidurici]AFS77848.1 putative sensory transduction histidine kinase [Gottschalkia acidurici 9a]